MSDEFVFCYEVESVDNSKGKVESIFFWKKTTKLSIFLGLQDHSSKIIQQDLSSQGFSKGVRGVQ